MPLYTRIRCMVHRTWRAHVGLQTRQAEPYAHIQDRS